MNSNYPNYSLSFFEIYPKLDELWPLWASSSLIDVIILDGAVHAVDTQSLVELIIYFKI